MTAVQSPSVEAGTGFGVHSEVGKLRRVMIHRPDLELKRLTPTNHDELLFDDVLWVQRARQQHDAFADLLRSRGVEVLYLESLLAETLTIPRPHVGARPRRHRRSPSARACPTRRGPTSTRSTRSILADHLIGGLTAREALAHPPGQAAIGSVGTGRDREAARSSCPRWSPDDFILRPLPNSYFTRDPSAWLYSGVVVNPMYWPARRLEALNVEAIYRFHPISATPRFEFWYSREQEGEAFGAASSEGGDIMPIGNRTVAIGMSERTTGQMIEKIALSLFAKGAADRVIAAGMTRDRAHMHLDTVFTFLDRDASTIVPKVVDNITAYSRPARGQGRASSMSAEEDSFLGAIADALGLKELRVIGTGGDACAAEREQWDDGNNVVALEPGVVVAYERNEFTNTLMRKAGIEVITPRRLGDRQGPRRRPLHDLPAAARPGLTPDIRSATHDADDRDA